jgi:hypothetical protein
MRLQINLFDVAVLLLRRKLAICYFYCYDAASHARMHNSTTKTYGEKHH